MPTKKTKKKVKKKAAKKKTVRDFTKGEQFEEERSPLDDAERIAVELLTAIKEERKAKKTRINLSRLPKDHTIKLRARAEDSEEYAQWGNKMPLPMTNDEALIRLNKDCILVGCLFSLGFCFDFIPMLVNLMLEMKQKRTFMSFCRTVPHVGHNRLAKLARQYGATHLLLLDDDTSFIPKNALPRLLRYDKDIITPFVYNRGKPFLPNVQRLCDRPTKISKDSHIREFNVSFPQEHTGLQPVDLFPTQFTLIKTSVFERLPYPWFHYPIKGGLQDTWLSCLVAAHGIQAWCDTEVCIQHDGIDGKTRLGEIIKGKLAEIAPFFMSPTEATQRSDDEERPARLPGEPGSITMPMEYADQILEIDKLMPDYSMGPAYTDADRKVIAELIEKVDRGEPLDHRRITEVFGIADESSDTLEVPTQTLDLGSNA